MSAVAETCSRCHNGPRLLPSSNPCWCLDCRRSYHREWTRKKRAKVRIAKGLPAVGKSGRPRASIANTCSICGYEWVATRRWLVCSRCRRNGNACYGFWTAHLDPAPIFAALERVGVDWRIIPQARQLYRATAQGFISVRVADEITAAWGWPFLLDRMLQEVGL